MRDVVLVTYMGNEKKVTLTGLRFARDDDFSPFGLFCFDVYPIVPVGLLKPFFVTLYRCVCVRNVILHHFQ